MLDKSKLNSVETLISQALIDIEISHEEFIAIFKEKDIYEKLKDSLRSENEKQKTVRLSSVKSKTQNKNYVKNSQKSLNILCHQKIFFLCMYKTVQMNKKGYKICEVGIIDKGRYFWVNRQIQKQNQMVLIGHRFLINVIQKKKNTDMN